MVPGKLHNITDKTGAELLSTELCLTTPRSGRGTFGAASYVTPEMGALDIEIARAFYDAAEVACAVNPVVATTSEKHGLLGASYCAFVRPGTRK